MLETLIGEEGTTVLYESPHRVLESLEDIGQVLGNRPMTLARELTKLHEEFIRGTPQSIGTELVNRGSTIKGEITLVIGRGEIPKTDGDPAIEVFRLQQELGMDRMSAIKSVARQLGLPKAEIYRLVTERSNRHLTGRKP